jgi:hypothetical protein
MTIYILSNYHKETAIMLDDRSLEKQIKDIAQVLCNVHWHSEWKEVKDPRYNIPLSWKEEVIKGSGKRKITSIGQWSLWARECKANYLYLVELGRACIDEHFKRFAVWKQGYAEGVEVDAYDYKELKEESVIEWARVNVPDLPPISSKESGKKFPKEMPTSLPLVMPKKYIPSKTDMMRWFPVIINPYRKYYQAKLKQQWKQWLIRDKKLISSTVDLTTVDLLDFFPEWTKRTQPSWVEL